MWPFSRKYSILESGILEGGTDWHCHILPGVDDGIRTVRESLEVLSFYEQTGIRDVWLTPHIMEDCPNGTAELQERFAALQAAYRGGITLHLGAENMMDNLFASRLAEGDLLTVGEPAMTLVETSYYNPPMGFEDTLNDMILQGRRPLLAHPERYVYMEERDYVRLKQAGVLFQLNLMSLAGMYGEPAAHTAARLLQGGMYDFAGSDLHRLGPWKHAIGQKVLSKSQVAALRTLCTSR
ncbi:MAG: capsular biosynthesis protein [Bacteroidales bacterium]|nr:capsular biosynthesis protein [Bacteroidales bacterium]